MLIKFEKHGFWGPVMLAIGQGKLEAFFWKTTEGYCHNDTHSAVYRRTINEGKQKCC